ncbi:hypothetical protein MesoLj131a_33150 [Mesorhizobium sp. 131-2-1]|nr:hypothetical protein MesoLj131a_33150 [Mesorhizobium sp. 131-2-1]
MVYDAGQAHIPSNSPRAHFLPASLVAERYSISLMTLWRWLRSDLGFPKPLYIGRNRYWLESDLATWEETRRAGSGLVQKGCHQ